MKTKSWTKAVGAFPDTNKTNFVIDWAGDLIYSSHTGSTSLLKKWTDTATQTLPRIETKDIDFGSPSQKKSVKKVYLTYRGNGNNIEIYYGPDGGFTSTSFTFKDTSIIGFIFNIKALLLHSYSPSGSLIITPS